MCSVICRNDHCYASRAQKPHFRVKTTKNLGKIAHSDTKTSILCSKGRKMRVPKPKSAQKCRFCAQRGSQNSTEKLGGARNSTERPGAAGKNHPKHNKTAWDEGQRPEAQRNATSTRRKTRNVTEAQGNVTQRNRHGWAQQKRRQPFGLSPLKIGGYLLSHMVVQYHWRK